MFEQFGRRLDFLAPVALADSSDVGYDSYLCFGCLLLNSANALDDMLKR